MTQREDCEDNDVILSSSDDRIRNMILNWTNWHEVMIFTTDERPEGWKSTSAQFYENQANKVYFKHFPETYNGVYEWKVTIIDKAENTKRSLVFYVGKGGNIQKRIANERTTPTVGISRIITPILDRISNDIKAVFSVRACKLSKFENLVEGCLLKTYDYCGNGGRAGFNGSLRPNDAMYTLGFQKDIFMWDDIRTALEGVNVDPEKFRNQLEALVVGGNR